MDECRKKGVWTLPALLGDRSSRAVAALALLLQPLSLVALVVARRLPAGALLALATLPFELRHAVSLLLQPRPATVPASSISYAGSMGIAFRPQRTWPLWYVAAAGWHAVTFGYWLLAGLLVSWLARLAGLQL